MQHRPRRLIGADFQRPFQAQCRNPVLAAGEQSAGVEPNRQTGVRVRSKIVPAVTEVRFAHPEHVSRPSPKRHAASWPQTKHAKPAGHRSHSR